jgi:hypothetical protein
VKYIDPDGRTEVYFLYNFEDKDFGDRIMRSFERSSIDDDVSRLQESGISVKIITSATKTDILTAFKDPESMLIIFSGHGYEKSVGITTADGLGFSPLDIQIEDVKTGPNLRTVIFENCYQGNFINQWKEKLGENINVVGWNTSTNSIETRSFNGLGIFNRLQSTLKDYIDAVIIQKHTVLDLPG